MNKNIFSRMVLMSTLLWFGVSYSMQPDGSAVAQVASSFLSKSLVQHELNIFAEKTALEVFVAAT